MFPSLKEKFSKICLFFNNSISYTILFRMILSFAFLFLFIGFHGLQYLQTSVNREIGSDALSAYYCSLAISSLIVPSFVVSRLGSKLTLVVAFGIHIIYMLANFLPRYYSLIPVSGKM